MNRRSTLAGVLLALVLTTGTGVAFTGNAVAQEPACWTETPTTTSGYQQWTTAPAMVIDPAKTYTATFQTSSGDVVFDLYADRAPNTVNSFVCLARAGYYDFTLFHRVISGFMIQSGDPTGTGTGGPGYAFNDELPGEDLNYDIGTLAMANSGPNTNGSQFFVVQGENGMSLPKQYAILGKVASGVEIIDLIAATPVGPSASGEMSAPMATVGIIAITITEA